MSELEEEEMNQSNDSSDKQSERPFRKCQTADEAAAMIQRAWRRYSDVSLYKKLKNLVNFRNQGDPSTLLRVINPIEAQLLDPAIGAHVKFRLGGIEWPPQIYYKIFLHSPVCDVNSYAPRNYFDKASADLPPISKEQLDDYADKFGWYKRVENNGWRPISQLSPTAVDIITQMTTKTESPQQLRKRLKRKKINKEVATIKFQRFLQQQKNQSSLGGEMPEITEKDFDDEEILNWADDLDLRQYMLDWDTLGTTGPSSNIWWNEEENEEEEDYSSGSDLDEEELMKLIS